MIQGAKKGAEQGRKPNIQKDTTASTSFFKGLYGLSEGEISGLVDGGKSIRLNGTPLINENGQDNFGAIKWQFRTGTLDQEHISGFPSVENYIRLGVELRHDRPFTRAINNPNLSAVRINLQWGALRKQHDNGDITGYKIEYAIDVQTDGGRFVPVLETAINDKASQGYARSHRIDLPKGSRWVVRVRRITPNADSELIGDSMSVQGMSEIVDAKLRYPCTALLGLEYDAQTFNDIAKLAVRCRGVLLQVPSNYNAQTRTYTGLWDGTFKLEYSNNPAWVFYDICTNNRYGLGDRLDGLVDKWSLYRLAQYCDEMVDDGKGGQEPRFTCNVYLQQAQDAYKVLQSIASIFRAMSYWNGSQIIVDADTPKDSVYTFSRANVVGGNFTYAGTRARDRHTVFRVAYDNPDNDYKTEYEFVRDEKAIIKYGVRMLEINAVGCTSQAQAQRHGLWAMRTEQMETRTVTFRAGLDGFIPQVGQVINIADDVFAGRAIGGRIVAVDGDTITLDKTAGKVGDTLVVNGSDGVSLSAKIIRVAGNTVRTATSLQVSAEAVWAVVADDLKLMQFRVISVKQNDDNTFDVQGLQYEPTKFDDSGVYIPSSPYSVIEPNIIAQPTNIQLQAHSRTHQGLNITTLNINWSQVKGAVAYVVEWRKDDGNWISLPKVASQSVDIDGIYSGNYIARVRAVDAFDNQSQVGYSELTAIAGKQGRPPRLARLTATGKLFGMALDWVFNVGSLDTAYTEIQVSPDGRSNITTLGQYAYPTKQAEINGLQGNLTQYYRGRIVDKLGNTSDWTAWVRGITDARADKVLDLLQGQISKSHLHNSLSTPIEQIGDLTTTANNAIRKVDELTRQSEQAKQSINNLTAKDRELTSSIRDVNTALTRQGESLGQRISGIDAKAANALTKAEQATQAIASESQARTTALERLSASITWQETTQGDLNNLTANGRYFVKNANTRNRPPVANAWFYVVVDTADGQRVTQTAWADNNANQQYRRIKNSSWTDWVKLLNTADLATYATTANLNSLRDSLTTANSAISRKVDELKASLGDNPNFATKAELNTAKETLARADNALSRRIDSLNSSLNSKANASAVNQLTTKVNQVDGKLTSEAGKLTQLTSTVNGQTAKVEQALQATNGLNAMWTLKVESGGVVSGIGLYNANGQSDFIVQADKFALQSPQGKTTPFSVLTSPTTINGVSVPAGTYIDTAYIKQGSITTAHIGNAQIDNAKIKDGAITTAKIGHAQIDTLQIKDGAVVVPRAKSFQVPKEYASNQTHVIFDLDLLDAQGSSALINGHLYCHAFLDRVSVDEIVYLKCFLKKNHQVIWRSTDVAMTKKAVYEGGRRYWVSDKDSPGDIRWVDNPGKLVGYRDYSVKLNVDINGLVEINDTDNCIYSLILHIESTSALKFNVTVERAGLSVFAVKR